MARVLLTGGTGYIGSHTAVVLLEAGYQVVLYDNLINSRIEVVDAIEKITGKRPMFIKGDVRDEELLVDSLSKHNITAVIHFAGLKSVAESVEKPLAYYDTNVAGSISLVKAMSKTGVANLIFSSSATVYGEPQYLPLDENHPIGPTNPYGQSKAQTEQVLSDLGKSNDSWRITSLRYFNPVGAHPSGLIGESCTGKPTNLMPIMARVAIGEFEQLSVYGTDYPTIDGTGVRDYLHVMDLAHGHLAALEAQITQKNAFELFNLGTGKGHSVLEMIKAFEIASRKSMPLRFLARRPGDVASCYASAEKARLELGWSANMNLEAMCESAWNFQAAHSASAQGAPSKEDVYLLNQQQP